MKLFLALTKVFSSECPRLCSPLCCDRSISLFSAGTDGCDVPGALGGLPVHFVSPVATILNAEQMFISIEMALIPFQLSLELPSCVNASSQEPSVLSGPNRQALWLQPVRGNKAERQVPEQHKAS